MESSHHVGAITELDLSACQPTTLVGKINAVPGLKTSAAFLTFLRANLVLPHSAMSSNVSTPTLGPNSSQTLPPVSPSPLATNAPPGALDNNELPPLSVEILTARADKAAALKLVADSVAQQRQEASYNLVFHPLPAAALVAVLAAIYRYAWALNNRRDYGTMLMFVTSAIMTYLLVIRYATAGYLRAAEDISWGFITPPGAAGSSTTTSSPANAQGPNNGQQEDIIIGTRFGTEIIGALVLRLEPSDTNTSGNGSGSGHSSNSRQRKSHSRQNSLKGGKGVIRAWTTRLKYRGKGVGADMLREAVRVARERCGRDAEVGFAAQHANSAAVLPERFNGALRRREVRAARALEGVLGEVRDGRRR